MAEHFQPKPMVQGGIMQFGAHAGERVEDLHTDYLVWYCQKVYDDMVAKRDWAKEELKRRGLR